MANKATGRAVEDVDGRLDGRTYVISGGTQGLGAATARVFAARGADGLVLCGRNRENGDALAAELSRSGCDARFVEADLTDVYEAQAVVSEAERAFGTLHGLVNAAGSTDRGTILDTTPDLYNKLLALNLRAPFFLMQAAAHVMRRQGVAGAMVNVGSMSGHGGQPFIAAYCAAKGGLATLTRNTAYALMRDRIRVNQINPGWMDTPAEHEIQRQAHAKPPDWLGDAEAAQPFGRLLKPSEVARAIAFLASDESGLMTGSVIDFDQSVMGAYDAPPQPANALADPTGAGPPK
ncbi:short-chain dehydrogenase [Rhodovibrio sodomensis]|uniref:Short-chain dehydrogenase n=1 Tax=Rhodovibrio sodomensis TaxID=1088 RepID=A0ABS1DLE7_9PROT|nr:SDR family oxidoreductase [Rhodovibrio sodomensis]MBK1670762.1 short-chain dehydrogenase [Rhodovibrio sodomensis]